MDELPHGFARIVAIRFRPDTLTLAEQRFSGVSAPLVRAQAGSTGIIGAANRETGRTHAISLWRTRDDLEQSNANPAAVEALGGYAQWMDSPFTVESFIVVNGTLPEPTTDGRPCARLTAVVADADSVEDTVAVLRQRTIAIEAASPECIGTLLLRQIIGFRVILFELWSSQPIRDASDAEARVVGRRLLRDGVHPGSLVLERLDVIGRH